MTYRRLALAASLVAAVSSMAEAAPAAAAPTPDWRAVKCSRYRTAWAHALAHLGTGGLSRTFLDSHEAFLASDCAAAHQVCPRSPEELKLANIMVIMAMNAGTASTFPPFACPK